MENKSRWHSQVRWAECDAAGIIYHARVFDWFSEARIQWLRDHDMDYYDVWRPHGLEMLVKVADAHFHHSLRPGDVIDLDVELAWITPTRASFCYRVLAPHNPTLAAIEGHTEHSFVVDGRAKRLDRVFPELFREFQRCVGESIDKGMF
ncbi:MAG: thioesterase family protein [Firmicutes bacterium]|nr:thioesterase family protein [Bacillota bacterium]